MKQKPLYSYTITLDAPIWLRKLVNALMDGQHFQDHLVGVADRQNDTHLYGATYQVRKPNRLRTLVLVNGEWR